MTISFLERGQPGDPRIRAHVDHGAQRAADAGGARLHRSARSGACEPRACRPPPARAVERRRVQRRTAAREPVRLLLSGPSGGAPRLCALGRLLGGRNLVGIDMGGTSFDVSRRARGRRQPRSRRARSIGCPCGCRWSRSAPSARAAARIATVGARRAADGRPRKRRRRGRARPATAAAAREPTVTDANLVLGRLDAESFLGGEHGARRRRRPRRDRDARSHAAWSLDRTAAADGILAVTNANLAAAIRL